MSLDKYTFLQVIKVCWWSWRIGRQTGLESDVFLGNILVDMYAKCGSFEDAWIAFNQMSS
jgi:pentatricopeptide repeat protein